MYFDFTSFFLQPSPAQKSADASSSGEAEDFLTADRMAAWLKDNKVLQIVLQGNLHQP